MSKKLKSLEKYQSSIDMYEKAQIEMIRGCYDIIEEILKIDLTCGEIKDSEIKIVHYFDDIEELNVTKVHFDEYDLIEIIGDSGYYFELYDLSDNEIKSICAEVLRKYNEKFNN